MGRGAPPERPLRGLDADRELDDPATRQRYVTALFDLVAPRYDAFTRRFSFGMDAGWKREVRALAERAAALPERPIVVVDLACGTGDLAFPLARDRRVVVGLDVSREMLVLAAARARAERGGAERRAAPHFAAADIVALPLPSASADLVTIGYGLRNASRLDGALDEVARVLRPGGHLVTLDFYKPTNSLWRRLFLGYLGVAGSLFGWAWHREPAAYGYIPRSIERFVTADQLTDALRRRGFDVYHVAKRLLGGICVHAAVRTGHVTGRV